MNDLILDGFAHVFLAFRLAEGRCFCNMLSPFAKSCSIAMKFPLLMFSTEKSALSSKGRACFAKNSTATEDVFIFVYLLLFHRHQPYIHTLIGFV